MARPREFDENAVLDAAVRCFWQRGYAATSVRDLVDEMGIAGASLYNAFGDKRSLFRAALDRYYSQSFGDRVLRFEHRLPPRQAISAFFGEIIERSLDDKERKGCLLVNSAVELASHDRGSRRAIEAILAEMEDFFRRCAVAGQADGSISTGQTAEDFGRLLLAVLIGIRVISRTRPERTLLEGMIRPVYVLLDDV
jgi:TetR/AcrR family transcriptional repressor of nem operon